MALFIFNRTKQLHLKYFIKNIALILLFSGSLFSCTKFGKNITVTGRVLNPITGEGHEGVKVVLHKGTLEIVGGKTVKTVYTGADGRFEINHAGGVMTYSVVVQYGGYDLGWDIDGSYNLQPLGITKGKKQNVDYHGVPYGNLITHAENINCSGPADSMQSRARYQFDSNYDSFGYIWREGCYNYTSPTASKVPMGYRYIETKVVRSGVTTYVYDTVFVTEQGTSYLDILY